MKLRLCNALIGLAALTLATPALAQPAPDLWSDFSQAVAMVNAEGVLLVETEYGVSNSRFVNLGQEYRDGWILQAATPAGATLKKGDQSRTVPYGQRTRLAIVSSLPAPPMAVPPPQAPQRPQATAPVPPANTPAFSNAAAGARQGPAAPRAQIDAAIQSRNVSQVYSMGGSADDVAASIGSLWPSLATLLPEGGKASYVNVNGQLGIRVVAGDRQTVIVPPRLAGQTPPPGAPTVTQTGANGAIQPAGR